MSINTSLTPYFSQIVQNKQKIQNNTKVTNVTNGLKTANNFKKCYVKTKNDKTYKVEILQETKKSILINWFTGAIWVNAKTLFFGEQNRIVGFEK